MKKSVWCKFSVDGVHNWADIPDTEDLKDVQFLKYPHRHMFGFKCYSYINHNNRDIEFIHMKRDVQDYLRKKYYNEQLRTHMFGSQSCEMLAEELINEFGFYKVEVDEDNENGGIVWNG
jgi:hypothetical protein